MFGFLFELDAGGVGRWDVDGAIQDVTGGFETEERLNLRSANGDLLGFMPVDYAYAGAAQLRLRRKFYRQNGRLFLFVGAPVLALEALPPGPIVFDPTFSDQPAEASAQDTFIFSSLPNNSYDTSSEIQMGLGSRHGLVKFDLTSIPAGATCTAATLSLWSKNSTAGTQAFDIYMLHANVSDWEETATWNDYKTSTAWPGSGGGGTSGTDYEADASPPSITYPVSSADTEAQADLLTGSNLDADRLAAAFGAGGTNHGFIIGVGAANIRIWHSSNNGTAGYRPKIAIDYVAGKSWPGRSVASPRPVRHLRV
jgi:hypothetical protein